MAGILDSKTRFIDLVVTQEGKRQIASGKLRAEFASISDMYAFYDNTEAVQSVGDRIYFQVMERPENVIVMEKDDSGKLFDYDFSSSGSIVGNTIFAKDSNADQTNLHKLLLATGSQFSSTSETLLKSFLTNFKRNRFIGTNEDNLEFKLSSNNVSFTISNSIPFSEGPNKEIININQAEPFLLDPKLTHIKNVQYLPPINTDGSPYGVYKDLRNTTKETWEDVKNSLGVNAFNELSEPDNDENIKSNMSGDFKVYNRENLVPVDTELVKEYKIVNFNKTSLDNNLIIQIFEQDKNSLKKLDIVDAGVFYDEEDVNGRFEKQVFYIGKIYFDDFNTPTFINIFTIVMD